MEEDKGTERPRRRLELETDVFRRPMGHAGFDEKMDLKVKIELGPRDAEAIVAGLALGRGLALPNTRVDWGLGPNKLGLLAVQPGGDGFLYFCDPTFTRRSGHVPIAEIAEPFGLQPGRLEIQG
jgi:hypothetical protein